MPIAMGGLDLDPMSIGYIMGLYGAGTGVFQVLFFAKLVRRFGTRRVFIMSMATFVPVFLTFPFISLVAKKWEVCTGVWLLVGWVLFLLFFMDTAYGTLKPFSIFGFEFHIDVDALHWVRMHLHVRHRIGA